jgi:hypothetical protein
MKTIDIKELIESLGFDKVMYSTFAKKTGKSEDELKLLFNDIVDKEINNVGKILAEGQTDESKLSRLRGLSLQDFMKDNDKIIKDK